eukprot:914091_1
MMKRKTQIKQHEVTIANQNTELQDAKEEVMELNTLLSGRDRNIATLKDKVAKQTKEMNQFQRESNEYQKAMLDQNTEIEQHEDTIANQKKELHDVKQQLTKIQALNQLQRETKTTDEVTIAMQHSEIQALQTHKSRLWFVLILSLICLPIFIGYLYQFHAQQKDTKAKKTLLQREIETTNSEHQSAMMKRNTQIKQ